MTHTPFITAAGAIALLVLTALAAAQVPTLGGSTTQSQPTGEQVTHLSLLTDQTAVAPGQSIEVGLMFEMDEHWHIYWINPGEAGMPPQVRWQLPEGFTVSDLRWPTPVQFDQGGGIIGYGYMNKVMLTATIMAPPAEKFPQGKAVKIEADVDWLVCKDVCLPGSKRLSVELPVGEGKPQNKSLFDYWNKQQPEPSAVKVAAVLGVAGKPVTVTLDWDKPVEDVAFFPIAPKNVTVDVEKITNREKSADVALAVHLMEKIESPSIKLSGLVVWKQDGQRHSGEVEFPVAVTSADDVQTPDASTP